MEMEMEMELGEVETLDRARFMEMKLRDFTGELVMR